MQEKYLYMGWVLKINIHDNDDNFVDFYKTIYYRNDEKYKIFDDYIEIEKVMSEYLRDKELILNFKLVYEPF